MRNRITLGFLAATFTLNIALGQGTINFNTRVPPIVDVRVFHPDHVTPLAGEGYSAQLFGGPVGAPEGSLSPLHPTTTFLTGAEAGYVVPVIVSLPGIPEGGAASLRLRVWENQGSQIGTFEQAQMQGVLHGQSVVFDIVGLGGPSTAPANLIGLQSFTMIPEPRGLWWLTLGISLLVLGGTRAASRSQRIERTG